MILKIYKKIMKIKKKEILVKFYLLNKEKTTKIKKLSEDFTNIKKHKKK